MDDQMNINELVLGTQFLPSFAPTRGHQTVRQEANALSRRSDSVYYILSS